VAQAGVDKGLEEQKRKMQEQEAAKAQADKLQKEKLRQDNCNRARQAKATWHRGRLLSHVNAKGERGFMDEAARDAEIRARRCRDRFRLRTHGRAGADKVAGGLCRAPRRDSFAELFARMSIKRLLKALILRQLL
jgi:hypothetical protein